VSGLAPHTYADEGDYTASVTVARAMDGTTGMGSGTITVDDGDALMPGPAPQLDAEPNQPFFGTVAFFTDTGPDQTNVAGDFTATIDWGDGTAPSTGTVSVVGNKTFEVAGDHTYKKVGFDNVTVTLADDAPGGAKAMSSATAFVGATLTPVGVIAAPAPIEGTPFKGQVGFFLSSNRNDTAASYTATIDWGDGAVDTGSVSGGNGQFAVSDQFPHIYADEGAYTQTVTVTRNVDGSISTTTGSGTIEVRDDDALLPALTVQPVNANLGQTFNAVATFMDTPSGPLSAVSPASDFTATIDWGDGTTSTGVVSANGGGFGSSGLTETLTVLGTHAYASFPGGSAGPHDFTVTLTDDGTSTATAMDTGIVYVGAVIGINVDPLAGGGPPPVERRLFSGQVATFNSNNLLDTAGSYSAIIDWGDGTSAGTIAGSDGAFTVSGEHTYFDDGDYPMKVTVVRMADGTSTTGSSPIRVGDDDMLIADPPLPLAANPHFAGFVANFADADPLTPQSDFVASIDWGDGTSTMGSVSRAGGTLSVFGSHTYAAAGQDKVTVTISDDAGGAVFGSAHSVTTMIVETLSVALSGTAREGATLIATPTLVGNSSGSVADVTYQWMRGSSAIGGATGSTYQLTEADELAQISVQASFTDAGTGQTLSATSNPSGVVLDPPPALSVSILGTAQENQTLQAIAVASSGDAQITYQWQQLDGTTWVNIAHATGATYQVIEPNEKHALRVIAKSSDPDSGNALATSAPTAAVIDVTPTISVTISGTAQEGQSLSATAIVTTDGDGGHTTYQWQEQLGLSWVDIGGATSANFQATEPFENRELRVTAKFTDDTGQSVSATSDPTAPVVDPPPTLTLTVTGIAQDGRTLTAHPHITSDADGGTTTYQWQRLIGSTWTDIVGAQASTHQVTDPDEGFELRATAVFTDDTGQKALAASVATASVIDVSPTLSVTISGTAQDGQTLQATAVANDTDANITFQWQQQQPLSGIWTDIAGATASSFVVDDTYEGRRLRVTANSADPDGGSITVNSAATARVIDPAPALTIASSSLFVAAGNSVALPISVAGFDADDQVSVTIAGLPSFETITDALDRRQFFSPSVTLSAAEVNSGLTLVSSYTGLGQPVNVLSAVARDATPGESSTSAAQTITVTDPPPSADNIAGSIGLLTNYRALAFATGSTGTLRLDNSAAFNGTAAGLALGNNLDLADLPFQGNTAPGYAANSGNTGGTLAVTEGANTVNIALMGNYLAGSFVASSDGHGGTLVVDPPPSQFITHPQA
jgi:hypothetical protein